ncbi:uncharacterized protein N7515_003332 [Penicillium bovifimosum]|uniref:C3H1-type domain-containing protein n=1 Tax=Penicillium bovifimosum TaxID=126998 RepID=A0A9W9H5T4_9EURO|nr:uncharacterized protein N7515_003332 [Penicillium bovifimosum]KAJ5138484.1 hypothetical protein N7515_003332 [Penicillium bovifimosum]
MPTRGRPQFFCARPDGTLTPLIAVDELQAEVTVRGVPRTLTARETQGMLSCGRASPRPEPWVVDGVAQPPRHEQDGNTQQLLLSVMTNPNVPEELRNSARQILCYEVDRLGISPGDTAASSDGMSPVAPNCQLGMHSGNRNAPKKEYCSYWLRHGECDYSQQGCMYKHQMPTDLPTLNWLGLRDIPRWYREKYNIPSLLNRGIRQPIAIANNPPSTMLPSTPPTDEGFGGNNRGLNIHPHEGDRLGRSPPRGPSNRRMSNVPHYGQYRGGYRNGTTGNWKAYQRNARHPATNMAPNSASGERSGEQYLCNAKPFSSFPVNSENSPPFGTGSSENDSDPTETKFTTATFGTASVAPAANNRSLLDDGTPDRHFEWRANNEADEMRGAFEHVRTPPVERAWRPIGPHQEHQHSSNPSTEGGVLLRREFPPSRAPMNDPFGMGPVRSGRPNTTRGPTNDVNSHRPSSLVSPLANLTFEDNGGLTSEETRVTWGPIGGPILKRTTPPADENLPFHFASPSSRHTD